MKEEKLSFEKVWLMFKETDAKFKETDAKFKETDARMDKRFKETDAKIERISKQIAEQRLEFAEQRLEFAEHSKAIFEQGKQIGGLNRSLGKFTEDLFFNSLSNLMKTKFGVQFFTANNSRELNNSSIEIDAMGIVNGNINSVFLTEIKSRYSKDAIKQLSEIINKFDTFFPELSDKKKFGIIAVPHLKDVQTKEILKAGFYPATLKNDMVVIETPNNFKAKAF